MAGYILAIDQGTTSSRAIVFDREGRIVGVGKQEFKQIYPQSGWVEHDPEEIWNTVLASCYTALQDSGLGAREIDAIGITNQRETTLVWDRNTGQPIYNAIVWQDRRTASYCQKLRKQGLEKKFSARTGLLLDPYFSGTKIRWILENVPGARKRAHDGDLLFGTIDTYLVWRLSGGLVHATDATNASRTLLYNITKHGWDNELLEILNIPPTMLPGVKNCADDFGITRKDLFDAQIPILGVAGDQHAATIGQACFKPGMMKSTYGTGCFALMNTGSTLVRSKSRLLTTLAYQLDNEPVYALEGSIFIAGAAVQWLRDGLGIIDSAPQADQLARQADENQQIYLVPAFVGLGAPWWDAEARGALFGLTRNTGPAELARAALESVAFQTRDLLDAIRRDWKDAGDAVLRVDGGMVASDWTMQRLADYLDAPVDRPTVLETTALGAAWLAGSKAGTWMNADKFAGAWKRDRRFEPEMDSKIRTAQLKGWRKAVQRTLTNQ